MTSTHGFSLIVRLDVYSNILPYGAQQFQRDRVAQLKILSIFRIVSQFF